MRRGERVGNRAAHRAKRWFSFVCVFFFKNNKLQELLVGVLDVDSSIKDCFNEADLAFLQQIVALLVAGCDFDFLGAAAPQ